MQGISTIHGPRRAAHAGYAVIESLAGLALAAARWVSQRASAAARAQRMAAIRDELLGMSEHTLRDIGLRRSQIDQLFR